MAVEDDLSTDQRRALDMVISGANVLVTGPGGTGKTYLIRRIVKRLLEKGKQVAVTALTGAAAALMTDIGARTLHSWGGILARDDVSAEDKASRVLRKRDIRDRWRETDILIIDEVSMMSPKLAIDVDVIARHVRGTQRGYKERQTQPFGGLQIVFVGDFFQLPPVVPRGSEKTFLFETTPSERSRGYLPPFSRVIRSKKQVVVLRKNFRQVDDVAYLEMLDRARYGSITDDDAAMLRKRLISVLIHAGDNPRDMVVKPTWLLPTRRQVEDINKREMAKLDATTEVSYTPTTVQKRVVVISSGGNAVGGDEAEAAPEMIVTWDTLFREPRDYLDPDEDEDPFVNPGGVTEKTAVEESDKSGQYDPELRLRVGAQVMITANLDLAKGIVNGTRGVVEELTSDSSLVRLRNGKRITVKAKVFETAHTRIGRSQLPLVPAWAVTIHKSQGQTLDCAEIDLGERVFADGQAYVALSRVKSLEGLFLRTFRRTAIRASPVVSAFATAVGDCLPAMRG
jgi:ATP-dependent DNA helicase PIF1